MITIYLASRLINIFLISYQFLQGIFLHCGEHKADSESLQNVSLNLITKLKFKNTFTFSSAYQVF